MTVKPTLLALLSLPLAASLLTAQGCDRDAIYSEQSVSDAIYDTYAECSESEIRWLTGKHNIQTVFEKCGSNNFSKFAWSPDGIHLYFQLSMTGHIINGEAKTITTLPTENPIGQVAWLDKDRVAMPLGPEEGGTVNRLAVYDRARNTASITEMDLPEPDQLQTARDGKTVYVVSTSDGRKSVYKVVPSEGIVQKAFPWRNESFDSFTYSASKEGSHLVAFGVQDEVTVHRIGDGEEVFRFSDATRAILHPDGRYAALETLGDPINPFDQKTWDEMSPEAREREQRRTEEWLARQPDWVPKEVRPPSIDIVDLSSGDRYRSTAFYGDHFEWYPDYNYYASFLLWGVEGKELNKNVALTNLAERLRMLDKGETPLGFQRLNAAGAAAPEGSEADGEKPVTVSDDTP